jgi:hypothetical protein
VGWRWDVALITLAFPAAFLNFAHGQNAFLSAALFGGALALLGARPIFAGILIGMLTFKPQLGLLIPFVLLAGGHWKTFQAAAITTVTLAAISGALFGAEAWSAFMAQGSDALAALREGLVGWNKMISTYAMLRLAGLPDAMAMALQGAVSIIVAGVTVWAWRASSVVDTQTRYALLLVGALLATPFGLNYDLFLLAPAMAFIVARGLHSGFAPAEKSLLALVYMAPFAVLWTMSDGISIAPFILALLFAHLTSIAFVHARNHTGTAIAAE